MLKNEITCSKATLSQKVFISGTSALQNAEKMLLTMSVLELQPCRPAKTDCYGKSSNQY